MKLYDSFNPTLKKNLTIMFNSTICKLEVQWAESVSPPCQSVLNETLYSTFHSCFLPNFN